MIRSLLSRPALLALGMLLAGAAGAAAQTHGVIAYAPAAGEWGWATHYRTGFGAEWRALSECRGAVLHGCGVAVRFRGACGAVAAGPGGWGAGAGPDTAAARRAAIAACGGARAGCEARLAVCSP